MEPGSEISTTALVFLTLVFVVEVAVGVVVARAIWRRQPKTVEGWAAEAIQVTLRVPATGALYAAAVLAFLWVRARL